MNAFLAWISQDKPYFCVVQSCPNLSICPELAVNMMRIIKIYWEMLGVPKTRSQKICPPVTLSSYILSTIWIICPELSRRVFVGLGSRNLRARWCLRVSDVILDKIVVDKFWTTFWRFGQIWTTILGFVQWFWTWFSKTLYNRRNTILWVGVEVCEFCTRSIFEGRICLVFQVYLWYNSCTNWLRKDECNVTRPII